MISQELAAEFPKMSAQEQREFFDGPLHDGVVTKTLHFTALLPLIAWPATGNHWFLLVAFVLPELGHIYDWFFQFDAQMRAQARQVRWLQAVLGALVFSPFLIVYLAVQTSVFG